MGNEGESNKITKFTTLTEGQRGTSCLINDKNDVKELTHMNLLKEEDFCGNGKTHRDIYNTNVYALRKKQLTIDKDISFSERVILHTNNSTELDENIVGEESEEIFDSNILNSHFHRGDAPNSILSTKISNGIEKLRNIQVQGNEEETKSTLCVFLGKEEDSELQLEEEDIINAFLSPSDTKN